MKKKALAILIPSLLVGGLFYTLNNTDPSHVEIAGEWSERFSAQPEAPFLSREPQQVLGEELAGQTAAEPVLAEEKRGFAGCRENQLNINLASAEDLEALVGIGQVISQKIIEERQKELFYSLDDLTRVYRIGAVTVANIKEQGIACAGSLDEGLDYLTRDEKDHTESAIQEEKERDFTGCEDGQININSASKEILEEIVQIGSSRAEQIIQLRQEAPFYSLEDLGLISGIAEGIVSQIKEQGLACVDHPDQTFFIEEELEEESEQEEEEEKTEEEITEKEFEGCLDGQINLDSASKEELQKIIGVGPVIAQRITDARPFSSVHDLIRVSGIGEVTLQKIIDQDCAYVEGDTGQPVLPSGGGGYSSSSDPAPSPEIILIYPEEIPVDEEIEIAFFASGLKEAIYDVKISIENEGILSRIYNAESGEWLSSSFYLTQVFSGTSFESQFKLKIREDRSDFRGTADIIARIRESGKTGYLAEFKDTINIAESESAADNEDEEELPEQEQAFEGCSEGQININSADQETLEMIVQIGPSRAEQIIQLRQELPFYSLDDLERVSGIAEGIISQIKEQGLACAACPSQTFFIEEEPEPSEEEPEEEPEPSEEEPEPEEEAMKEFEGCKDGQININVANKDSLIEIYQIGDSRADQIIELREIELFWSIDDMVRISGIGESYVQKIREQGLACAAEPY